VLKKDRLIRGERRGNDNDDDDDVGVSVSSPCWKVC
jgi:hypothetical protein